MSAEIKIETGVPIPPKYVGRSESYPISTMKPGESFLLKGRKPFCHGVQCRLSARAKKLGIKITTRMVEGGLRVWRLE